MWRDLIRLRTGRDDRVGGLRGDQIVVHHLDTATALLGWLRWGTGGIDGAALVVANFSGNPVTTRIGVPTAGTWTAAFDSTWSGYHPTGSDVLTSSVDTVDEPHDGQPFHVDLTLDSYASAIFTRS